MRNDPKLATRPRAAFRLLVFLFAGLLISACRTTPPAPPEPRNLVLIVSDSLRADILGCYGGPAHTPNIDSLARRGVVFHRAYSTAPCTLPSSVAMLTGNYSRTYAHYLKPSAGDTESDNDQYCFYVPDSEILTAERLRAKGITCIASIENQVVKRSNILQGFQTAGDYQVRGLISKIPPDKRFFLLKWFMDPHAPYNPPAEAVSALKIPWKDLPRKKDFYTRNVYGAFIPLMREGKITKSEIQAFRQLYRAEVEWMDRRVGMLLEELNARPDAADTLVVFTSDHGELIGEHNRIGHSEDFWEPLVRIPLIFKGPGIKKNSIMTTISHLDLIPTLAYILFRSAPEGLQGESYHGALRQHIIPEREPFFDCASNHLTARWINTSAMLSREYKLVVNPRGQGGRNSLYRPYVDQGEMSDFAAKHTRVVERMYAKWKKTWRTNRKRLQANMRRLGNHAGDLKKKHAETQKILKSLGYL